MEFAAKGAPHQLIAPADHKKPHYHFALTKLEAIVHCVDLEKMNS
jgi:hypothetical protein